MAFVRTALPLAVGSLILLLCAAIGGASTTGLLQFAAFSGATVLVLGLLGAVRHWRTAGLIFVLALLPLSAAAFGAPIVHPSWALGFIAVLVIAHAMRAEPLPQRAVAR